MKHILLAGYGNIAKTFKKIMEEQEDPSSYHISICDIKNGNNIIDYLPQHKDNVDIVINTSLTNSILLSKMCVDFGIDYVDVGIEEGIDNEVTSSYNYVGLMKEILKINTPNNRLMLGFGINPGILEHIYQKYKPQGKHYAFELEHDDSKSDEYKIFGTWSPFMYVEESVFSEKILIKQNREGTSIIKMDDHLDEAGGAISLSYHGEIRQYLPVCHEELITMAFSNPNLLGTGYLFQAPKCLQKYCLEKGKNITQEKALSIPVPANLKGKDQVGILFWDLGDNIFWIKNVMSNKDTWDRYGRNAVCWQTATGAWIGYKMIDKMQYDHPHTMTEVSQLYPDEIDHLLDQIGMHFEREDHVYDIDEFKDKVIKYFK